MSSKKLTELKNRITYIREDGNLTKAEFAERLGISGAYVTDLEAGKNKNISKPLAQLIYYEFGFISEWTLTGHGPMKKEGMFSEEGVLYNIVSDDLNKKILLMLKDMPEEDRREILKHIQEKKLLEELMKERLKKEG